MSKSTEVVPTPSTRVYKVKDIKNGQVKYVLSTQRPTTLIIDIAKKLKVESSTIKVQTLYTGKPEDMKKKLKELTDKAKAKPDSAKNAE